MKIAVALSFALTVALFTVIDTAHAAIIFGNVDPSTADLNALASSVAGGHESNTVDSKNIFAWGLVVGIPQNATLRTAVAPFNVGPSTGLRLDVFQVAYPLPHLGFTPNVITSGFTHLGSSAVVENLGSGHQWITFSFNDIPLLAGQYYLFRASPDQTNGSFVAQQHYWLGVGAFGDMVQDIRYFAVNSPVPANTFGLLYDTTLQPGYNNGGLQLTDVAIPEPASLALIAAGSLMLVRRRLRA